MCAVGLQDGWSEYAVPGKKFFPLENQGCGFRVTQDLLHKQILNAGLPRILQANSRDRNWEGRSAYLEPTRG